MNISWWVQKHEYEINELFYIFKKYYKGIVDGEKDIYRDFCILLYNKTDEQNKSGNRGI